MFSIWTPNDPYNVLVTQLSGAMFVGWFAIYFASYPLSSAFFKKTFGKMTAYQQYDWCSRVVSTVHAMISVSFALYTMLIEKEMYKTDLPFPERMTVGVGLTAAATLSYWVYDLILIISYWKVRKDYAMVAHHLSGIVPFSLGTYYHEFMCFAPTIILAESSTPFVNARWFMAELEMQSTIYYAVNGLMMWLSFLFCRILWLPYGLFDIVTHFSLWTSKYHLSVLGPVMVGTPIAYALSCYWFTLITKGLVKVIFSRSSPPSPSKPKTKKD